MIEPGPQLLHAGQGVADGLGQGRFARYFGQLRVQPCFQIVEDGIGPGLSGLHPYIGRLTPNVLLDATKTSNSTARSPLPNEVKLPLETTRDLDLLARPRAFDSTQNAPHATLLFLHSATSFPTGRLGSPPRPTMNSTMSATPSPALRLVK